MQDLINLYKTRHGGETSQKELVVKMYHMFHVYVSSRVSPDKKTSGTPDKEQENIY